jgi:methylglyoxal synthase
MVEYVCELHDALVHFVEEHDEKSAELLAFFEVSAHLLSNMHPVQLLQTGEVLKQQALAVRVSVYVVAPHSKTLQVIRVTQTSQLLYILQPIVRE